MSDLLLLESGSTLLLESGSALLLESAGSGGAVNGAASLASVATLTGAGQVNEQGSATLAAVATLSASGTVSELGSASLASVSTLAGSGLLSLHGSAALAGVATLSASGQVGAAVSGAGNLSAVATLTAAGSVSQLGSAAMASVATLAAAGSVSSTIAALYLDAELAYHIFASIRSVRVTPQPALASRDADVIDQVIAALRATRAFDEVAWGETTELRGRRADMSALATVEPGDWQEVDEWGGLSVGVDGLASVVRATFHLTLYCRDKDNRARDRRIDQLLNLAKNAIDGQSFGGRVIPDLTILRRGKYSPAQPPERRMTVVGEYAILVDGSPNHGTSI